ncbi:polymeric immunoglobulin receptor-like [Notolabrus celidotus]|uniref:polymeric immunoglobulin receptor-like n=1 Tax=Notolabrus celidotus TaxID=1203425 RepID=UPI00148F983C|nr:polymeric immunoglobulin receptor-like [Notolabrus celidotus]
MACQIIFLLILSGLTGLESISTVSKVSVKTGGSISIPCPYGEQDRDNVKYLCKGYYWNHCSYAVKTNWQNTQKYSISDDRKERIFTVTIRDLREDGYYWCAVERNGQRDIGGYFHLSVTKGTPSLYMDHQEFRASKGGNITFMCYHGSSGENQWCRLGGSCVTKSSGSIEGTEVTLIAGSTNFFTVTMSGLKTESSGWYLCVRGDLQMPVHLNVTEQHTTNTVTPTGSSDQHSASEEKIIIPLSVLIVLVIVTLFSLLLFKIYSKCELNFD